VFCYTSQLKKTKAKKLRNNDLHYFPTWRVATAIKKRVAERGRPIFGAKLKV